MFWLDGLAEDLSNTAVLCSLGLPLRLTEKNDVRGWELELEVLTSLFELWKYLRVDEAERRAAVVDLVC